MKKEINRWKKVGTIGEGGQNRVFLVEDSENQFKGQYALKKIKSENTNRLKREIELRSKLDHRQIPKVIYSHIAERNSFLIEEYINGGALSKNRSLFEGDSLKTLRYFLQICEVVDYAHKSELNIIHRDIKPDNILYDCNRDLFCLTDFGISYAINYVNGVRLTETNENVGARYFSAPELERGRSTDISDKSDVYSLGKLLHWMLTNKYLYRENFRDTDFDIVRICDDIQLQRVNELFEKMIVEKTNDRFWAVDLVVNRLRKIIHLMEREFNVINAGVYQTCTYCGVGNINKVAVFYPAKMKDNNSSDPYFVSCKNDFERFGVVLNAYNSDKKWLLLQCDYCGNVNVFVRENDNYSWEDPKYRYSKENPNW